MRVEKVSVEIVVPEKATHFSGHLTSLGDVVWYYCKVINDCEHWFLLLDRDWVLSGHSQPRFIRPLSDFTLNDKGTI